MILELSQLAFTVCKEDFFHFLHLFRVPYLDICLDSFFSLVFWIPEFNIASFVCFLQTALCLLWNICAFVFRFISFLFFTYLISLFCIFSPFSFLIFSHMSA